MKSHQLVNQDSGNVELYTPLAIIEAARSTLGRIELDPASCAKANEIVRADRYYTAAQNGLLRDWDGRIWMNHPFGANNWKWIFKLTKSFEYSRVPAACCITFAATSEAWFKPLLRYPQCFLTPRTNYIRPDGSVYKGVPKGSVVTYLGRDVDGFAYCFRKLGVVKVQYDRH